MVGSPHSSLEVHAETSSSFAVDVAIATLPESAPTHTHCYIQNRQPTRTYCIAQGTLLSVTWEKNLKKYR